MTRSDGVLSVVRAMRLLEQIADRGEARISDLARQLGWTKSMVHRLAATLEHLRYLEQDVTTRRYRLGLKVFALGSRVVWPRELRRLATPVLEALMEVSRETVHLTVLDEATVEVVYVHKVEPPQAIRLYTEIGAHHPAFCAATGKAILAFLPEAQRADLLAGITLHAYTSRTLTDRNALLAHLRQVREQGYAVDDREYREEVRGVAAPVWDHAGRVVAAVNVGGPAVRLTWERVPTLAPLVLQAAAEISCRLGHRGPGAGESHPSLLTSATTQRPAAILDGAAAGGGSQ